MPFRRRVPLTWKERLHDLVWPRIGLRRLVRLYWYRLHRLPGSPASIAAGFGWGIGVSMNPLIGTHIILGVLGAWLTRSSMLAAAIATFAANPWTATPIWLATFYAGRLMQGELPRGETPGFIALFGHLVEAALHLDVNMFLTEAWPIVKTMLLGSVPVGIVVGLASYAALKPMLARLKAGRSHLAQHKLPHPTQPHVSH